MYPTSLYVIPQDVSFVAMAYNRSSVNPVSTTIHIDGLIGKGTFGHVYKARLDTSERWVALKQVIFDPCYQIREVDVMTHVSDHCNIVRLIMHCFAHVKFEQTYMLMAVEYMPMTLLEYMVNHCMRSMPLIYVRIFSYQLFRGLAHLHSHGISHRDVKPDNILINPVTMNLKLSDFGSAKFMKADELSTSYVCSRYYRAPELFAKCQLYTTMVDIWSAGCVMAEMLKGSPLFLSKKHGLAQLQHVVSILGTDGLERAPSVLNGSEMYSIAHVPRLDWQELLGVYVPSEMEELLNSCLIYCAADRIGPLRACAHATYDELRTMAALEIPMPNGQMLPPLFNFSSREMETDPGLWSQLLPLCLTEPEPFIVID